MPGALKVIKPWMQSYSPALSVAEGECVTFGERDDDWPGWVWCRNRDGLGGWLPEDQLSVSASGETAVLMQAFDTVELTVEFGERLEGFEQRSGWIWCRNAVGRKGWVPSDCVTETGALT